MNAQNTWKGGTIGNETDWNTAKNWSKNQVPDWKENVIIADVSTQSGHFPVIDEEIEAIPHLVIQSNAILKVLPKGTLNINGHTTIDSGIILVGDLIVEGEIRIANTILEDIDEQGGKLFISKEYLAKN